MKKTITVRHLGMEGEGPTAALAKKNAEARIEATLTGDWDPHFIVHRGLVGIILRQPATSDRQWGFKVIDANEHEPVFKQWVDLNYASRADAVRAAAYSLAQRTNTYLGLKPYLVESQLAELDRYFDWQTAYRLARVGGKPDVDARREADELMARRDVQKAGVAA